MDYIRKNCGEKSKIMGMVSNRQKDEAIANFRFEGVLIDERPYGSGHINDTFLLTFDISGMGLLRVILQRNLYTAGRIDGERTRCYFLPS